MLHTNGYIINDHMNIHRYGLSVDMTTSQECSITSVNDILYKLTRVVKWASRHEMDIHRKSSTWSDIDLWKQHPEIVSGLAAYVRVYNNIISRRCNASGLYWLYGARWNRLLDLVELYPSVVDNERSLVAIVSGDSSKLWFFSCFVYFYINIGLYGWR